MVTAIVCRPARVGVKLASYAPSDTYFTVPRTNEPARSGGIDFSNATRIECEVRLPEGSLRGHTFHHSLLDTRLEPLAQGECPNYRRTSEAVFRDGRLTASYIHFYLPSNPQAAAALFRP